MICLPLILGFLSYVAWRPSTRAEVWLHDEVNLLPLRDAGLAVNVQVISDCFAYMCWAFALYGMLKVHGNLSSVFPALLVAYLIELGQLEQVLGGTFSVLDLVAMSASIFLAKRITDCFNWS
jgi:hypothetical protein